MLFYFLSDLNFDLDKHFVNTYSVNSVLMLSFSGTNYNYVEEVLWFSASRISLLHRCGLYTLQCQLSIRQV